ncbi:MAG: nucleotidyltransferase domain-containing protein [Firmicutes bacterium]|nr:nucleotidyltransferase domain-containing protein [Bacillota bacterium]
MSKFRDDRARTRTELVDTARRYASIVGERYAPATVLLYGSVARGDFNLWSDIDVLVVSDALPSHPLARSEALYAVALPGIEPKGYTLGEYRDAVTRGLPFVRELSRHCVVLRDDLRLTEEPRPSE